MRMPAILTIVAAILLAQGLSGNANAQGCTLDGIELSCGDGNNASVLEAMAAAETADLLSNPIANLEKFKNPADLEKFRKSVETNWGKVNKVEQKQRNKMLRRQISAAEFDEWSKIYNFARNNYSAALTYYRTLVWHGKTGKSAPEG